MKKCKKRIDQYRAILASMGKDFDKHRVLSFGFKQGGTERYHLELMMSGNVIPYILFDGTDGVAQVVIPEDADISLFVELAGRLGGTRRTPILI